MRLSVTARTMIRPSKVLLGQFRRISSTPQSFKITTTNNIHHLNPQHQKQVLNAINQNIAGKRSQPFKTFFQIAGLLFATITIYSSYKVGYKKQKVFIPLYISKTKRAPHSFEVDEKVVQVVAEEQLLERLSLNNKIQTEYRLPITLSESIEFDIWIEEKDYSIKGLEISPNSPLFKKLEKPIKFNKYITSILEPLGGKEEEFKIPVVNTNDSLYDTWFLGTLNLKGKNGNSAMVVYKGIFDSEHIKQAKITKAHLIVEIEGKKKRVVLWDK